MAHPDRRRFLRDTLRVGAGLGAGIGLPGGIGGRLAGLRRAAAAEGPPVAMQFGLVTYLWGADWDLPTLVRKCEDADVLGVELRTTHDHGVEIALSPEEREKVRERFHDSPVQLVGIGSNERFDHPDEAALKRAMKRTRQFVRLSHDVGGTGVKVKPNSLHDGVPREKTIEQIARSLNELGRYGEGWGQEIRVEAHGDFASLPLLKELMDAADHRNVAVCWNCNPVDTEGEGLEHNLNLVKDRLGGTLHVHELNDERHPYPYEKLMQLLADAGYDGWVLLEGRRKPEGDRVAALRRQKALWERMF